MISRFLILLGVFVVVGFGPALAQDLFVRKDTGENVGKGKPTLYVKPKSTPAGGYELPSSSLSAEKLKMRQKQALTKIRVESLAELIELGVQPRTAAEIDAYGRAHRANSQALMYKRREALLAYHGREQRDFRARLLERQRQRAERPAAFGSEYGSSQNAVVLREAAPVSSGSGVGKAQSAVKAKPKRKLFVRPSTKDKVQPAKVFNPY